LDGGRADAIEMQYLLLSQDVAKPLHRCVLVKVGNSVRVLDLDIADGTVAARSKVGVEVYKRLRATVFLGDVDAHAGMFVVFGRDIFEDSHLDLFIAVRVEWFFINIFIYMYMYTNMYIYVCIYQYLNLHIHIYDSWSLSHLGYLYPGTTPVMIKLDHNRSCP